MRRGLSEIVGGMIILAAVLAGTIALAATVTKATNEASTVLEEKIERASRETDPILIIPYISDEASTLRVYAAPLEPSKNITIIVVGEDEVISRNFKVEGTYLDAAIIEDYDCSEIVIAIIDDVGSVHFYNALNDPRVNLSLVKDPHIFSCSILNTPSYASSYSSLLDTHAITLDPPPTRAVQSVRSPKTLTFYLYGYFKASGEDPGCKYKVEDQYRNVIASRLPCGSKTLVYNGSDYRIWLKTALTGDTIVGYILIESPGIVEGQVRVRMSSDKTYLQPPEGYGTYGDLDNVIIPLVLAPITTSASIYYEARVYPPDTTGRVSINLWGDSTGRFKTQKPVIIFISTTKVPRLYVNIRVDLTLYGYTTVQLNSTPQKLELKTCGPFYIDAKPLFPLLPKDPIAKAVNIIPSEDWDAPTPIIKATVEVDGGESVIIRELHVPGRTILDYDNITSASIIYYGSKTLPPLTSYNLSVEKSSDGSARTTYINGTSITAPIASKSHLPILATYRSKCGVTNIILNRDNPASIELGSILGPDGTHAIIRVIGPMNINPELMNASLICLLKGDPGEGFTSAGVNTIEYCTGEPTVVTPQSLYIIVVVGDGSSGYPGFVYRLLWSN